MSDPRHDYRERLDARSGLLKRLERRDAGYANGRLAVFSLGLGLVWLVWGPASWPFWVLAFPVLVFVALVVLHEIGAGAIERAREAVRYYEAGLARLDDRWAGRGISGEDLKPADHLYAEDLDLFGEGSLFELLCLARTRGGEEALAAWLCTPASAEEVERRQSAVSELRDRPDLRELMAVAGGGVRAGVRPALLERWASSERQLPGGVWLWASWLLTGIVLASGVAWGMGQASAGLFVLTVIPSLGFQRWMRDRVRRVLRAGDEPLRDLQVFAKLAAIVEQEHFDSAQLASISGRLTVDGRKASSAVALLARLSRWQETQRNAMFAPVAISLMWAVHFAYAMEGWRARYGVHVPDWLRAVGEFEALCSLATYAYEHPADPYPELVAGPAFFEGASLGHPLLPEKACVRNSVSLRDGVSLIMVSGSNMSGKSTLLRTVGINAVLAFAGAPVRAERLRLSPMALGASLHIVDSIQRGTSHFYAEILRLRDLHEKAKEGPVLFLIDEILHGTNSHDRKTGSEAVLRGLVDAGSIGLVTTHDLALTDIVGTLDGRARNVHFVDRLENDRLVFDYSMCEGVVQRSNAIALMRSIGLDVGSA